MTLTLGLNKIRKMNQIKILRILFDCKLTWSDHILQLKAERNRRLNAIKSLSAVEWGFETLLIINTYKYLIRSKLD